MDKVILVSACLLGINCRYDGGSKLIPGLRETFASYHLIPFCPETLGGLAIPRPPAEIAGSGGAAVWEGEAAVMNRDGADVTMEFKKGAAASRDLVRRWQPSLIIFKAHSPSCGIGQIYDGSFSGTLRNGDGVTVALLRAEGVPLITEKVFLAGAAPNPGENCR